MGGRNAQQETMPTSSISTANTKLSQRNGRLTPDEVGSRLDQLREEVLAHPIVAHPFLTALKSGGVTPEGVRLWVAQQFYFSTQFPRCLAALFSRVDDYDASKLLIPFLNVEHWGSSSQGAHWRQFVKVLEFFGLDAARLRQEEAFAETRQYLDYRLRVCINATIEEGLGTLGFAHELINERIFAAYLAGMETMPGVTGDALSYFKAHVADEPGDYLLFREMTLKIARSSQATSLVRKGALATLAARSRFFDRTLERIVRNGGLVLQSRTTSTFCPKAPTKRRASGSKK